MAERVLGKEGVIVDGKTELETQEAIICGRHSGTGYWRGDGEWYDTGTTTSKTTEGKLQPDMRSTTPRLRIPATHLHQMAPNYAIMTFRFLE